jgi:nitrous oxidase accessory protein NosD
MKRACLTLALAVALTGAITASASATTRVVDNTPSNICKKPTPNVPANNFTTIQAAIDASNPNDTVLVCPGTYEEQVTIDRNSADVVLNGLKLIANTTYAARIDAPSTITGDDAIVTVNEARKTEVRRFKITGPGPGACNSIGQGVRVKGDGESKVEQNQVLNIRDEPFSGCQNGSGIVFGSYDSSSDTSTDGDGTAIGNTVTGYQKNGITVNENGSNVLVSRNTVTGVGRTGITAQNGIQVGYGATGKVDTNKVDANYYTRTNEPNNGYVSGGILMVSVSGLPVLGNQLSNDQYGLLNYDQHGSKLSNNRADGGDVGVYNDPSSTGNTYDRNRASNNTVFDCEDDSTGGGTAGTGNTWTHDLGLTSSPAGICTPPK